MRRPARFLALTLVSVWMTATLAAYPGDQAANVRFRVSVSPGCTIHVEDGWIPGDPTTSACVSNDAEPLITTERVEGPEPVATDEETTSESLGTGLDTEPTADDSESPSS